MQKKFMQQLRDNQTNFCNNFRQAEIALLQFYLATQQDGKSLNKAHASLTLLQPLLTQDGVCKQDDESPAL